MSRNTALANIVIERMMPKGYTWVKFKDCWTGDLAESRFFPPSYANGEEVMPAALFATVIVYDQHAGWHERDVKFQGRDAQVFLNLKEAKQIARINAEGHVVTRTYNADGEDVVTTTVFLKEGGVSILETVRQSPSAFVVDPEVAMPAPAPQMAAESEPEPIWPGLTEVDCGSEGMDEVPF